MFKKDSNTSPDLIFLILFGIIAVFGMIMLSSASTAIAFQRFGDSLYYVKHQLMFGFFPGLFICTALAIIDYRFWRKFAFPALVVSILLLIAVFIPGLGRTFNGSRSWLQIGGIVFQPVEIVKLGFILYLSVWLEKRDRRTIKDFSDGLMPFLISLGIIMGLILLQPDVGSMGVIVMIALMIYFVAGADIKHLFALGGIGVGLLAFLIKIAPYRAARFTVFLHPEADPQGLGYHINQALLAIGSGGLVGLGFAHSRQKHLYLPEAINDSIFAIMAEELGFVMISIGLAILLALIIRGYHIARQAPDEFGRLITTGIISWIGFQSFINIAAMVGLMPITGLPLPFVSYGSSSLVVLFAAVGIVINVSRHIDQAGPGKRKSRVISYKGKKKFA